VVIRSLSFQVPQAMYLEQAFAPGRRDFSVVTAVFPNNVTEITINMKWQSFQLHVSAKLVA